MDRQPGSVEQQASRLAEVLRGRREEILVAWEQAVRKLPKAERLETPVLRDEIPRLLLEMADAVEGMPEGRGPRANETPQAHALQRLDTGFDLEEVVTEYALLRQCIVKLLESEGLTVEAVRIFSAEMDGAIVQAASRYHRARERTLKALDRLAAAAVDTDLEEFLPRLVRVLVETTPSVDVVAVFLREGNRLKIRASVGLEREMDSGLSVANERVVAETLRERGARALYGVPLVEHGELAGVAYMASHTAYQFSDDDRQLFRAMASRATSLLALYRLTTELQKTGKERELFLSVLGHDLRNPLAAIMMSADNLRRRRELPEAERNLLDRILKSASRMERMIGEILDFARVRLGKGLLIERTPIDLHVLSQSAVDELQATLPDRAIRLEARGGAAGEWDAAKLTQVVSNLLSNALQHGATDEPVVVRTLDDGEAVLLEVENGGDPIPAEIIPRLFDPFVERGYRSKGGLGLGLYIVASIVAAHGGTVTVDSTQEKGTTFRVRLPRRPE